ncbi:hypothetical protein HDV01_003885 [Terramyces sp. JEL0728]|nr:hypothetical protein HDV01_003885 [Terramyces sp. JEL0728]
MLFCQECINNQNLVLNIIQNSSQDEDIEKLHKKYPQVCKVCEPKVELYLKSIQTNTFIPRKEEILEPKKRQVDYRIYRKIISWYLVVKCILQIIWCGLFLPEIYSIWSESVSISFYSIPNSIFICYKITEYIIVCFSVIIKPKLKILKQQRLLDKTQITQLILITIWTKYYYLAPAILYYTLTDKQKPIIIKQIDLSAKKEPAKQEPTKSNDILDGIESMFLASPTEDVVEAAEENQDFFIQPPRYFKNQESTGLEDMFGRIGLEEKKSIFSWK